MVLTLVQNSKLFVHLICFCFFVNKIIMTGEPMHIASKERMAPCAPDINYRLKSEVTITLRCQLCSTRYTALRIKNCSTSAIKVATRKIWTISITKGSNHMLSPNRHFSLSANMNGTQRRTLVSSCSMHCIYCRMPKGTSHFEQ